MQKNKYFFWVNFIFLRKKCDFPDVLSASYGQRSVTAAWATRSPWSILLVFSPFLQVFTFGDDYQKWKLILHQKLDLILISTNCYPNICIECIYNFEKLVDIVLTIPTQPCNYIFNYVLFVRLLWLHNVIIRKTKNFTLVFSQLLQGWKM